MLKTEMGNIEILLNGKVCEFSLISLNTIEKQFIVDRRYKIIIEKLFDIDKDIIIECKLTSFDNNKIETFIESGESLALISFYYEKMKLSLGVEDEISNIKYEYLNYGLKLTISKGVYLEKVIFGVAWLYDNNEEKDIYTWLAADPTLY